MKHQSQRKTPDPIKRQQMKKYPIPTCAVVLFALLVSGCETDGGIAARIQEKSAVYTQLQPWEQRFITKGTIANGFSQEMVYMAVGRPSQVEPAIVPGGQGELWTYDRFYPYGDAVQGFRFASFSRESAYQPQMTTMQGSGGNNPLGLKGANASVPFGMGGSPQSIGITGGPQGGTMEPADLQSYKITVLFRDGKTIRITAALN